MICCCRRGHSAGVRVDPKLSQSPCICSLDAAHNPACWLQGFSVLSSDLDITLFRNPLSPQV